MLSLKIEYDVPEDRGLHIQLPVEIQPGKHEIVVVVDNVLWGNEASSDRDSTNVTNALSRQKEADNRDANSPKINPADIVMASGFIGCGEADPLLSENYKAKLTEHLREKHGDR